MVGGEAAAKGLQGNGLFWHVLETHTQEKEKRKEKCETLFKTWREVVSETERNEREIEINDSCPTVDVFVSLIWTTNSPSIVKKIEGGRGRRGLPSDSVGEKECKVHTEKKEQRGMQSNPE